MVAGGALRKGSHSIENSGLLKEVMRGSTGRAVPVAEAKMPLTRPVLQIPSLEEYNLTVSREDGHLGHSIVVREGQVRLRFTERKRRWAWLPVRYQLLMDQLPCSSIRHMKFQDNRLEIIADKLYTVEGEAGQIERVQQAILTNL